MWVIVGVHDAWNETCYAAKRDALNVERLNVAGSRRINFE